ncbi:MAG: TetR/AcrR family transcriptional regulator [Chloroflexi bacterium]|nr:TetR/AcrR family transcriptional regulator [Chloroflexota bacterium]
MIDRREEIADVFMKHFHHFGFKKTSVDEVAGELHISKKTIYEYFDSKEDIFRFIIQREADRSSAAMEEKLRSGKTASEKIAALVHMIFSMADSYIRKSRNLDFQNQEEITLPIFRAAYEGLLAKIIKEGNQAGEIKSCKTDLELSFVKAVILHALEEFRSNQDRGIEPTTLEVVMKMIR